MWPFPMHLPLNIIVMLPQYYSISSARKNTCKKSQLRKCCLWHAQENVLMVS